MQCCKERKVTNKSLNKAPKIKVNTNILFDVFLKDEEELLLKDLTTNSSVTVVKNPSIYKAEQEKKNKIFKDVQNYCIEKVQDKLGFEYRIDPTQFLRYNNSSLHYSISWYFSMIPISEVIEASTLVNLIPSAFYLIALKKAVPSLAKPIDKIMSSVMQCAMMNYGDNKDIERKIVIDKIAILKKCMAYLIGYHESYLHVMCENPSYLDFFNFSPINGREITLISNFNKSYR